MGIGQALMQPPANVAWYSGATVTPKYDLYRSLTVGTGFFNSAGSDFHADVVAGNLTAAELAQCKYVYAPDVQHAFGSLLAGDETKWGTLKTAYANAGLDRPRRLLVSRHDICRWMSTGYDYYLDGNIHDKGPMWDFPTVTTFPGDAIAFPPYTALDPGYESQQSGLSFSAAKAVLDGDGWTWSNYTDNPWGANIQPYEFSKPGAKQFRLSMSRVDVNDDDWVTALANLLIAALEDTDLPELDGIMGSLPKLAYGYYTGYRGGSGLGPGYPSLDDPESTGSNFYLLEYWTRTRTGAVGQIDYPWTVSTDTPSFPSGSGSLWDNPNTTAYEYIEGTIKLAAELRSRMPPGKELHWALCLQNTDQGIWQSRTGASRPFRLGYRDDYIAVNGGTQQEAQDALLAKIVTLRSYCDGIIIPSSAETGADPNDGSVTAIEPVGWWEDLAASPMKIQYGVGA